MNTRKPEFHDGPGARILGVIERIDSDPGDEALDELHQIMDESPESARRVIETTRRLHAASVTLASEHSVDEWIAIAKEGFAARALGIEEPAHAGPAHTLGHLAGRPAVAATSIHWYSHSAKPIALAAVVAGISALAWYYSQANASKVIPLPDASSMRRYAQSRIEVNYSARERRIDVEKGGAAFKVEHDQEHRPFHVYSGELVIAATGTQFNVYKHADLTDVYLEQGSLDVMRNRKVLLTMKDGDLLHIRDNGSLATPEPRELDAGGKTYVQIADAFNKVNTVIRFEVRGAARTLRAPPRNSAELTKPEAWIEAIRSDPALHVTSKLGVVTIEAASSN